MNLLLIIFSCYFILVVLTYQKSNFYQVSGLSGLQGEWFDKDKEFQVGTFFLGALEAAACVAALFWLVQQVFIFSKLLRVPKSSKF